MIQYHLAGTACEIRLFKHKIYQNSTSLSVIRRKAILETRTMDFPAPAAVFYALLPKQTFRMRGVESVIFGLDFIAFINKSEDIDWNLMKPEIYATILDFFASCFQEASSKEVGYEKKSNYDNDKELLKTRLWPTL